MLQSMMKYNAKRGFLMSGKKKIIAAVCAASVVCLAAVATGFAVLSGDGPFTGKVTDDAGNGIANVSVTDGRNVVKTDANGAFTLKGYRKSHFVTVTVPAGYQAKTYYLPVEKDRASYDFVLTESDLTGQTAHSFLQISDTEIGTGGTGEWLESIKELVREENPAFLIHTGDICYEDGLKRHIQDMNTDTMGCTVYYTIGNHDYVDGAYGEELYESLYGPVWYSFEVGNVHYCITSFQNGSDYRSCYGQNDRWRWLENDLANTSPDMQVVIFNHTFCPTDDYVLPVGLHKLDLKEHNLVAWAFGHYHYQYVYEQNGVLNISTARPDCGGIDSSVSGTRIVRFDENGQISTDISYYDMTQVREPQNAAWVAELQGDVLFCDPAQDGNSVYIGTSDDNFPRTCGVYRLNAATGAIEWFRETKNSIKNNVIVTEDAVFAMDADGNVYALNKESGEVIWETALTLGNSLGTSSAMCTDGETLYAGCARVVTALSMATGEKLWETNRDKGENSPAEFILAGDKLLVNSHWDALAALDKTNGKELWGNQDGDIRFRSSTPIVLEDGSILVADSDAVMLVNAETGDITSKTEFDNCNFSSSGQPAVDGKIAYIPTGNKGLIAFDLDSKEIVREMQTDGAIAFTAPYIGKDAQTVESTPVINGGEVIFGASDGYIYRVEKSSGKILQKYDAGSPVFGKVIVSGSSLIAGTLDGKVVCFS